MEILYCDDQERFRTGFKERHKDCFNIETLSDIHDVYSKLMDKEKLPDLLILDLYHPKDIPKQNKIAERAEKKLQELKKKISEVKKLVYEAWDPIAIDVLRQIRKLYSENELPVMIYTQRGLFFLDDKQIREIEELGAEWLLKDFIRIQAMTESVRILKYIHRCKCELKHMKKKAFIVHGHDSTAKYELAHHIKREFGLEPVILHEQPEYGLMTILDKFEHYSKECQVVFVLLTPDDKVVDPQSEHNRDELLRARQNVIFELGYFVSKLGRNKVIVLYKGGVEIPSDISGIIYIPFETIEGVHLKVKGVLESIGII